MHEYIVLSSVSVDFTKRELSFISVNLILNVNKILRVHGIAASGAVMMVFTLLLLWPCCCCFCENLFYYTNACDLSGKYLVLWVQFLALVSVHVVFMVLCTCT